MAIDPPQYARTDLAAHVAQLHVAKAGARLAPPERWHVTVAFLGEVPDEDVVRVRDALSVAASGPSSNTMTLHCEGGGRFGRGGGTVLWVGVAGEVQRLRQLARAVGRALRRARFSLDRKPYRPHVTIARPGTRVARHLVTEDLAHLAQYRGPDWQVTTLHLVRSHLGADPRHERVASFPLRTPTT